MKLNWAERLVVNNPLRAIAQGFQIQWLKRTLPLKQEALALEIGCGRGAGARLILREFSPSHLHIMDLDIKMVKLAKGYLSSGEKEIVSFFVGDATRLPLEARSLDAVFGFGFLHHVPDWRAALKEIARVLKAGGLYFMEELYPSLYQNIITRHILVHPTHDRFWSQDLRKAMMDVKLPIKKAIENERLGIVGVAIKDR